MGNVKFLGISLLFFAALTATAEAKLYKWVDDKGETHYGETIPPEYADRDNIQFNDKGQVIKRNLKESAEERRAREAAAAKKSAEEGAALEQRRKDKMLLNTYSSEKEIDLARDRNLQQVEALITSIQLLQLSAQESLLGYQEEAEQIKAAGRKIPASLRNDITDAESKSTKLQQRLIKAQEKAATVRANFEADKVRYHDLTGGSDKEPQTKEESGVRATQKR